MDAFDEDTGYRGDDHDDGGPGGHQQPGCHVAVSAGVLQVEGQGHQGEHLPEERADRRGDRHREDRDAQQVERQQRVGLAQLRADEQEADDEQGSDADREDPQVEAVRETLDGGHHQTEGQCVHHGIAPVEFPFVGSDRILGQEARAEHEGGQPDGDVHGEKPRPAGGREDGGGQGRPGYRRNGHDRGVDPHAAPELRLGVDDADERRIDRRDGRCAESLHDAGQHEGLQRSGEGTADRGDGEQGQSADVDPAVADPFAKGRKGEQRDHDRKLVGIDDPDRVGRRDPEFAGDRRQGDIGNRRVDNRERDAERHGQDGPDAAGHRNTVPGVFYVQCVGHDTAKIRKKRKPEVAASGFRLATIFGSPFAGR